jgi:hypothetical protein
MANQRSFIAKLAMAIWHSLYRCISDAIWQSLIAE